MRRYVALVHAGKRGSYGVSFPDFPGCIAAEAGFEAAVESAARALRFHAEGMIEDGETIPGPRSLEQIRVDPEFADDLEGAIVALVPLLPPRGKPERVNVSLDSNLLAAIDRKATELGLTRSALLAEGARAMLETPAPHKAARAAKTRPSVRRKTVRRGPPRG